jgi:acetyl esterase/lipase
MKSQQFLIKKIKLLLFFSFFLFFVACNKDNDPINVSVESEEPRNLPAAQLQNIVYGENERNVMDVFLPENRNSKTPVLILIHGGSWSSGDKAAMNPVANMFSQNYGIASISINYRLIPNYTLPAQMEDIQGVVNKIIKEQPTWHISKENIYLFGVSAGAHLSLLYAYGYDVQDKIKGVISMCGPTNFVLPDMIEEHDDWNQVITELTGYSYEENPESWQQASPYYFVNSSTCSTILAHCEDDSVVPYSQAVMLNEKLEANGVETRFLSYPQGGHLFLGVNLSEILEASKEMILDK